MLLGMRTCEELDFALEREREGQRGDRVEHVGDGVRLGMMGVHLGGWWDGPLRGRYLTFNLKVFCYFQVNRSSISSF